VRWRGVYDQYGLSAGARRVAFVVAIALLWCNCAYAAETRVYLLRGWFGVFSSGIDGLAANLNAKGIKAEAINHTAWKSAVSEIVQYRAAGNTGPLVLVGHSQGGNNVIEMARALETHKIPVDLVVTLAPFMQDPVPANVLRATNYYQKPGWGTSLTADRGFHGKLSNINVLSDQTITHVNIDKSARIQAEVVRAILALSQPKEGAPPPAR
jgi:surfactin synthase thioesterase subunit